MGNKMKVINRDQLKYIAAFFMFIGHFFTFTIKELHFLGLPSSLNNGQSLETLDFQGFSFSSSKIRQKNYLTIELNLVFETIILSHKRAFETTLEFIFGEVGFILTT